MVFNILMDNTDDHEKNHALLRQPDGAWLLSPAYDVVTSAQGLGYQALAVGRDGARSSLDNALSQARAFGLDGKAARAIVQEVAHAVAGWRGHFAGAGVTPADLDVLAQYLDLGDLGKERAAFAS
jgi:serine/threonine-protein kinase HipA